MRAEGSPWRIVGRLLQLETGEQLEGCAAFPWESGQPAAASPARRQAWAGAQGEAGGRQGLDGAEGARLPGSWLGKWEMVVPFLEVREHGEHSKFNFENLLLYFFPLSDLLVYQN